MQGETIHPVKENGIGKDGRFHWNGYSFPVLPSLSYQADGPDKNNPDRLFTAGHEERFMLYFEAGGENVYDAMAGKEDYDTVKITYRDRCLKLCYPEQHKERNPAAGYFSIGFLSSPDGSVSCDGTLSITPPERYFSGIRKYTELYSLFTGAEADAGKDGGRVI